VATIRLPRGPKGHWLLGHMAAFRDDPLGLFTRSARDYGDFVPLRFGPARLILISNPDDIEYVLITNNRNFVKDVAVRAIRPIGGNGLFLSEGDFWLRQRRLMQPAFHRQRIASYAETMVAYTQRMLDSWQGGETRDVHHEMTHLTMTIVAKTLFDADVGNEAAELGATITRALECLSARLGSLWLLLPDTLPLPMNVRMRREVRRLDEVVYRIIDQRRASGEDRGDLLSMLLHTQDEDDGSRMTDLQVRDEAMTLFLAGHETTATTLAWAWYLLSQHPEAEARLVAEVQAALAGRAATVEDLQRLHYAEMVVTETLRLYPPVMALGREPIADCQIGGYPVRKGTSLIMSPWVLQRDPRYFEEPARFEPDRWADGLAQRLPRFAYFPFGGGPRLCIGSAFATMEATLVLATVAQRYRLRLAPGQIVVPAVTPTLRPKHGLKMVVEAR